jgi:hypothetical protein
MDHHFAEIGRHLADQEPLQPIEMHHPSSPPQELSRPFAGAGSLPRAWLNWSHSADKPRKLDCWYASRDQSQGAETDDQLADPADAATGNGRFTNCVKEQKAGIIRDILFMIIHAPQNKAIVRDNPIAFSSSFCVFRCPLSLEIKFQAFDRSQMGIDWEHP